MKLYVNLNKGKAYTQAAHDKYIHAMAEVDGAFENWLDENFLPSEVLYESKEDLYTEFVEWLEADFDSDYTIIEVELA